MFGPVATIAYLPYRDDLPQTDLGFGALFHQALGESPAGEVLVLLRGGYLGASITFLVWLWFTNIAILIGAQIDAEIERERELAAGIDAQEHIQLPVRESGR